MEEHTNRDAFGQRHRSTGNHNVGDSMPGTVGDAQQALHDAQGQTPIHDPEVHIPSERTEETQETTEANGQEVEELLSRIKE